MYTPRNKWQVNFPKVVLNAALGEASKHIYYSAAKSGDLDAALLMLEDLINPDAIQ